MFSFGEEPANAGDMAAVQCAVIKGDLPIEIVWMFADQPIYKPQRDIIISDSGSRLKQLTIEAVAARHAGEYTCIASNAAGSVSRSAVLNVNGTLRFSLQLIVHRKFIFGRLSAYPFPGRLILFSLYRNEISFQNIIYISYFAIIL